ncbi:hypothetical protein BV20DRAFT_975615 [Pilatotrama ljubarskyi]|nr:hypothetical protein BV20DRAFT_975615 [Pilatotrama ljubarskyi]
MGNSQSSAPFAESTFGPSSDTFEGTSTLSSPKRKSQDSVDAHAPSPDAKRARPNSSSSSGGTKAEHSPGPTSPAQAPAVIPSASLFGKPGPSSRPSASARPTLEPPVHMSKSAKYWYDDGNVVIGVHTTLFRLHRSRLAQHCAFFATLFGPPAFGALRAHDGHVGDRWVVDGCPVYHTPAALKVDDFECLLDVLERPSDVSRRAFSHGMPTQTTAAALLRASHALACGLVFAFAEDALGVIWGCGLPPKAPSYTAALFPGAPAATAHSDGVGAAVEHTYLDALFIILLARRYNVQGVLKRAFYELIASQDFWDALTADRKRIRLPEGDLLRLYNARHVLEQRWREAAVVAPCTNARGESICEKSECRVRYGHSYSLAKDLWRDMVLQSGLVDVGARDPMRYELLGGLKRESRDRWCAWCLREWEEMMGRKRREWWALLDQLMHLD